MVASSVWRVAFLSITLFIIFCMALLLTLSTLVALMAGLAIFPLIFTYGLESVSGPSLLFISLPPFSTID
jgi:NSS family neurotransmitter:Na+ symporter